jgi:WhiB family redox-sensing transcriptional regulator
MTGDWTASEVRWQDDAACAGLDLDRFVPDKEDPEGLAAAREICGPCPVRVTCLQYAMVYGQRGYWGGTDTEERKRLKAKKDRAKCPSCASRRVVGPVTGRAGEPVDLCIGCGLSWPTAAAATPRVLSSQRKAA